MIRFEDVWKSFGTRTILKGVSLTVETGSILFIVGTSGAGKSVLVKQLIGLLRPDKGRIFLDEQEVTQLTERELYPVRKRCAMVFQHSTLFDSMTLVENVELPLRKHRNLTRTEVRDEAMRRLSQVSMESEAERYPADIGDGLRKRVAIAR
ncbi:MAG: phospholipid/cholesterol/gamma-HCH transport system ATP-binding protein, partial [Myxococcota bacterium]